MTRPIYISVPMGVDVSFLNNTFKLLNDKVSENCVEFWIRGTTYDPRPMHNCKALVVILPGNCFRKRIASLPAGTRGELEWAIAQHIPIFLSYRTTEKKTRLYETGVNCIHIEGIGGTFQDVIKRLKSLVRREYQQAGIAQISPNYEEVMDACSEKFTQQEVDRIVKRSPRIWDSLWWYG